DGEIISHKYKLHLPQRSAVCVTIKPLNIGQVEGKSCPWLSVDTALYILKENETQENLQLVSFTEQQNKEMFGWKGELGSGVYWLLPFTTGCRLKKVFLFSFSFSSLLSFVLLHSASLLPSFSTENFDMKKNELTRQGFMDLNLMEANDREGDPSDLWVTLLSLGYNKALEMTEACPFVIDIYAERCKPRIKALYLEAGSWQLNRAICKAVLNKGEAKVMDG
ncbi:EFCB7 protein, partial [Brachypteracias leptosomus]|nr:EFCB7 protein [Brachypteracias leptosomus]